MYGFGKHGLFNPQKVCSGRNGLQAAGLLRCDGRRRKAPCWGGLSKGLES